ncbi:MAG TPA: hypothetical protein VMR97_01050 [Acidimicrobiales bacterium]|nr:hypothetical protein [Acidimicrobiales bacterium]
MPEQDEEHGDQDSPAPSWSAEIEPGTPEASDDDPSRTGEYQQPGGPQPGYPPPHPGFAQPQPGYPQPPAGYPPPQPGYPPPHPGYPSPHPGYPQPPTGYPPQPPTGYPGQPGYPQPGYPQPPAGYPGQAGSPQPGYPPQPPAGYPGQPGYPQPGYPPPPAGYTGYPGYGSYTGYETAGLASGDLDGGSRPRSKRGRIVVTVVAVVLVVGLLAGGGVALFGGHSSPSSTPASGPVSSAPVSPAARSVLRRAISAARAAGSFHYVSRSTGTSGDSTTVGDAGADSGKQVITSNDKNGASSFTVLVVGTACYFQGDALAMQENLGVTAAIAQAHANQWISLSPSDQPYGSVYAAVNTGQALTDNITLEPQHLSSSTGGGRKLQKVTGAITPVTIAGQTDALKGTASLEVSAATHLPVSYSERGTSSGQTNSFTIAFSDFGQPVSEAAPQGAVSFASIAGSGSSTSPSVLT